MRNWTGYTIKTEPAAEPVSLTDVKMQLAIGGSVTEFDDMLNAFITAARQAVESYLGRTLITTEYELYYDSFFPVMEFIRPPVQSVSSVSYIDTEEETQTLDSDRYRVDTKSVMGRLTPSYGESFPDSLAVTNAVTITFTAGYGSSEDVPQPIRTAIKQIVSSLFEHRDADSEINLFENKTIKFLLQAYQVVNA